MSYEIGAQDEGSSADAVSDSPVSLIAHDVTVTFDGLRIVANKSSRNPLKRVGLLPSRSRKTAVNKVSLIARSGERIGLVGRNGSGKSTFLRALAGLEYVSTGSVIARTQPVLLGVNPALVPDRTGYENITLGLLAMGLSPAEARDLVPKVAELADLGTELDDPINTYSSGMGSRLRFAIAASNPNTEILIIDEALGTGDAAFQKRSETAVKQIVGNAGTIFFVSHVPSAVRKFCDRALWFADGTPIMDSTAKDVAHTYQRWTRLVSTGELKKAQDLMDGVRSEFEPPEIVLR